MLIVELSFDTYNFYLPQYTYDNNDRLTQQGGTVYTYDNSGNTLTETLDGEVKSYTYNTKNQLIESSHAGETTSYQYNVDGIRTAQTTGLNTTQYIVDSNRAYAQVVQERVNNATTVNYTYGDDLLSQTRGTQPHTYHYDGLGSTRSLSNSTGAITDTYAYDAFGQTLNQTGTTENSYLYTGEQYDSGLGQYYLRARYYNQGTGRFTQQDTWMGNNSDPITLHKYLYGNADPVNHIDPSGNFSLGSLGSGLGVLSTLSSIATTSYDIFSSSGSGNELSAKEIGTALMISAVGGKSIKLVKVLARKICNKVKKCKVPILDVQHIFHGDIRKRTARGFHSTYLSRMNPGRTSPKVIQRLWTNVNGVYKARVKVYDYKTGIYREKSSTMFPDTWRKSYVAAALYASWMRNKGKQQGKINFGATQIQYYVRNGLLQGFPTR